MALHSPGTKPLLALKTYTALRDGSPAPIHTAPLEIEYGFILLPYRILYTLDKAGPVHTSRVRAYV